jgi:hypothetical protein
MFPMSRHTKFAITAAFLVFIGIAIASVAISRQPQSPLRFTLDPSQKVEPRHSINPSSQGMFPIYYVQVENTGSIPVLFHTAALGEIAPGNTQISEPTALIRSDHGFTVLPPVDDAYWLIPPRSSIRCVAVPMEADGLASAKRGHTRVGYVWTTRLRYRYIRLCSWFHERLPLRLQESCIRQTIFRNPHRWSCQPSSPLPEPFPCHPVCGYGPPRGPSSTHSPHAPSAVPDVPPSHSIFFPQNQPPHQHTQHMKSSAEGPGLRAALLPLS